MSKLKFRWNCINGCYDTDNYWTFYAYNVRAFPFHEIDGYCIDCSDIETIEIKGTIDVD